MNNDQQRVQRRWSIVIVILLILLGLAAYGCACPKEKITVMHIVREGETLQEIGKFYADPSIKDPRYLLEFTEGVYAENYETVFMQREHRGVAARTVFPGDRLLITFWAVVDYD
jgi:hypothetical protein